MKNIKELLKSKNISLEDIEEIISSITKKEYGLIFEEGKPVTVENLIANLKIVTNERLDLKIEKDATKPNNLLIEGDNINSLAYLIKEKQQVDVIYIDPPYNTGNREFTYKDSFTDRKDSWGHKDWLEFMNKRLLLSRELLKDDGVIFVSIDDNEQAELKLLLNKVYGEENFLGTIIQNKGNSQNDAFSIQKNHEYIHVYTKKNARLYYNKPTLKKVFKDENGWFYKSTSITTGGVGGALNRCPTLGYTIYFNPTTKDFIGVEDYDIEKARKSNNMDEIYTDNKELIEQGYIKIRPPKRGTKLGAWTWSLASFNAKKKYIHINKSASRGTYSVLPKKYVSEDKLISLKGVTYYSDNLLSNSRSFLDFPSAQGTSALTEIFNYKVFSNPKNISMLKYFIALHTSKDAVVLDFFAGSGSTGQAVLELNKEDGGNRKFILCTNNEITSDIERDYLVKNDYICKQPKVTRGSKYKEWLTSIEEFKASDLYLEVEKQEDYQKLGICRSITYERIKSIIDGYTTNKGKVKDGIDGNLVYIKSE